VNKIALPPDFSGINVGVSCLNQATDTNHLAGLPGLKKLVRLARMQSPTVDFPGDPSALLSGRIALARIMENMGFEDIGHYRIPDGIVSTRTALVTCLAPDRYLGEKT